MWRAFPDRAQPVLHVEPLDVPIGKLLAPNCPSTSSMVIDGSDTTSTQKNFFFVVHHSVHKASKKRHNRDPLLKSFEM